MNYTTLPVCCSSIKNYTIWERCDVTYLPPCLRIEIALYIKRLRGKKLAMNVDRFMHHFSRLVASNQHKRNDEE